MRVTEHSRRRKRQQEGRCLVRGSISRMVSVTALRDPLQLVHIRLWVKLLLDRGRKDAGSATTRRESAS